MPRAGAHRNGIRDVEEARTSPLLPPESRRLGSLISAFMGKVLVYFAVSFGSIQHIPPETLTFFVLRKVFVQKVGHVFAAFRSSNAAKSLFCDKK